MALTLIGYSEIRGILHCESGTRVGGSKEEIEIGGLDNPVIRHPLTRQPYIPGSSLKGKLRSLLEYCKGRVETTNGRPCGCARPDCPVCRLFGPHFQPRHDLGPSRLIFRDAMLTQASHDQLQRLQETGLDYVEVKTETMIDRRTQIAGGGTLRTQERVPAGTEFELTISVRLFNEDNRNQLLGWLGEALALLEKDTLGGSGTRGYGWVKLQNLTLDGQPWALPQPACGGR